MRSWSMTCRDGRLRGADGLLTPAAASCVPRAAVAHAAGRGPRRALRQVWAVCPAGFWRRRMLTGCRTGLDAARREEAAPILRSPHRGGPGCRASLDGRGSATPPEDLPGGLPGRPFPGYLRPSPPRLRAPTGRRTLGGRSGVPACNSQLFTPRRSLVRSQYRPPSSAAGCDHATGRCGRRGPAGSGPPGYLPACWTRSLATHSALPQVRPDPRRGLPHRQAGRNRASQAP